MSTNERVEDTFKNLGKGFDFIKIDDKMEQISHLIHLNNIAVQGDLSDVGNEIGYAVGQVFENMTQEQIDAFITGFKHGVSLTNGTH